MKKSKEKTSKQKIPTYNLLRPTGNGAFGMVYQAKDAETGQIVAIKKSSKIKDTVTVSYHFSQN